MAPTPRRIAEADENDPENGRDLQQSENQLELSGLLDAGVIEQGNKNRGGKGNKLSVCDCKRPCQTVIGKEAKNGKRPRMRTNPVVTVAIEAGFAIRNQVQA